MSVQTDLSGGELLDAFRAFDDPPPSQLYPCTAIFVNECPVAMNVHIIAIGAKFFYDDGSDKQAGPVAVDLGGGGSEASLSSPDVTKCTVHVLGVVAVKHANDPPQNFQKQNDAVPGHCMIQTNFVLAPKSDVAKDASVRQSALTRVQFETR